MGDVHLAIFKFHARLAVRGDDGRDPVLAEHGAGVPVRECHFAEVVFEGGKTLVTGVAFVERLDGLVAEQLRDGMGALLEGPCRPLAAAEPHEHRSMAASRAPRAVRPNDLEDVVDDHATRPLAAEVTGAASNRTAYSRHHSR